MMFVNDSQTLEVGDVVPTLAIDNQDGCGARLAECVKDALRAASYVPEDDVDVEVRNHAVYLSGTVKWEHQRVAAERAVEHLEGVHVLRNRIRLIPRVSAADTRREVLAALNGKGPGTRIEVDVDGETVTLAGTVASYTDWRIAEQAARSMPHVQAVRNELRIVRT